MTDDEKRVKFHELRAEVEALEASLKPKRDERDKLSQAHDKKMLLLGEAMRKAEKPLFDKKMALAQLGRELRGPDGISRTAMGGK